MVVVVRVVRRRAPAIPPAVPLITRPPTPITTWPTTWPISVVWRPMWGWSAPWPTWVVRWVDAAAILVLPAVTAAAAIAPVVLVAPANTHMHNNTAQENKHG